MTANDLLSKPIWQGQDLGRPIPGSVHSVSVALPRWKDVVGYEEKDPETWAHLTSGYPRFVIHPLIQEVAKAIDPYQPCLPFPSQRTAESCVDFIHKSGGQTAWITRWNGLFGVTTTPEGFAALKAFWQHTGVIVSTRQAEHCLGGKPLDKNPEEIRTELRRQLAGFYECDPSDIFLTPTGMAAQYAALRVINQRITGCPTVQLGFPYVDTFKLQQKLGNGGYLIHQLDQACPLLIEHIQKQQISGCFCEIPGNPLLGSVDVRQVLPVLRSHRIPLVVDDVVASPYNIDLHNCADLIASSLTKFIVGNGEAMGGALICNPASPLYRELKPIAQKLHEELLWPEDAAVIFQESKTFPERMEQHNSSGLWLAEQLRAHPMVEKVWYPKWEFADAYEAVRRSQGGWSALITFLPRNAETTSPKIYNAMKVSKGPSLGTSFTLACPFTLLAHYNELDWVESCGISRFLIRLSIGLENREELWQRIKLALETA